MSGITKILTRTPSELGSIKTNKSPIVEENKQLPAEQWNTAADAIIEIQTVIGEAANPAAGTITEVLSDHEERIDELEQNGGGGGGTPGHVICNVVEDEESPLEPVPQRANLVFFSDAGKVEVQDFEELDATVVLIPEGGGGGGGNPSQIIYDLETPNGQAHAYADVSGFYDENTDEEQVSFQVDLRDSDNHMTEIYMTRGTEGQLLVLNLDQADPSAPSFSMVNHSAFGDPEFRLRNAPTLIETPTKPAHAATKAYVDARLPTLEWWDPTWTPMDNVDDVANVECQYTRVHRAAGGSLVTLEGAITVTPTASGSQCVVMADLPIAKPGAQFSLGMATGGLDGVNVSIADTGDGDQLVISGDALGTEVVPVTFRISYRAA